MRGKNHLICATVSGLATSVFLSDFTFNSTVLILTGACLGGLIPDIDLPDSTLGKVIKPISKTINKLFGHRTITHSGLWLIPLIILYINYNNSFLMGYIIGFVSHLLADTLTAGGIAWTYPLNKKRLRFTSIKSGKHDGILTVLACLIMIFILFALAYFIHPNT